jgi:hypothetical protein
LGPIFFVILSDAQGMALIIGYGARASLCWVWDGAKVVGQRVCGSVVEAFFRLYERHNNWRHFFPNRLP